MNSEQNVRDYFSVLAALPSQVRITDGSGRSVALGTFYDTVVGICRDAHAAGRKVMFVGNGGSSAVASHMACDLSKNGGIRSVAFNDAATITCLSNDFSYEQVFSKQVELYAATGDVLFAISSSGNSINIHNAVSAGRERGCIVVTLSGFSPDNPLREMGDFNLYVPNGDYGFVEIAHLSLCHAITDMVTGWKSDRVAKMDAKEVSE
jgi:D-sedoheptulose 7-phosphate isomerase